MCSPNVLRDLPVDSSLPCFYSALSSSLVFFWHPLSHEVSPLTWFSGIEILTPTEWLTLHHGSVVDSLLLMVFVLWVTWEAPLRKWPGGLWWQSRPSPVLHWQGKRPHIWSGLNLPCCPSPPFPHGYSLHMLVLKLKSQCQARLISDSSVFPRILLKHTLLEIEVFRNSSRWPCKNP